MQQYKSEIIVEGRQKFHEKLPSIENLEELFYRRSEMAFKLVVCGNWFSASRDD